MTVTENDVVRCVAEWDMPDGTIAQIVYHFLGISPGTATDAQMLAAVIAALQAAWLSVDQEVSDLVLGSTMEVFLWDFVLNRFDGIGAAPLSSVDGTGGTDMLPHGAAALGKIFTSQARRQARKYVPGFTETAVEDGSIVSASLTQLALFLADLDDDIVAGSLTLSFGTFNTDPASALFETFSIASGTVQGEAVMAYQRRRRPGTGI